MHYCLAIVPLLWLLGLVDAYFNGGLTSGIRDDSPVLLLAFGLDVVGFITGLSLGTLLFLGGLWLEAVSKA